MKSELKIERKIEMKEINNINENFKDRVMFFFTFLSEKVLDLCKI